VYDVCIVGHVTCDVIRSHAEERRAPGGAATYVALALRRLGRTVSVVTKVAAKDETELLHELRAEDIPVSCTDGGRTTVFHNLYPDLDPDHRIQRVTSVSAAFTRSDLGDLRAHWFCLGPLTSRDMSRELVEAAAERGPVALDAQGLIRRVAGEQIELVRPADAEAILAATTLLHVDEREAEILSNERGPVDAARKLLAQGPSEVIVTAGSRGSLVLSEHGLERIDAVPGKAVDPTGCGDTYLAAYLHRRLASEPPARAGRFAASAATLTLECEGPFRDGEAEVRARME